MLSMEQKNKIENCVSAGKITSNKHDDCYIESIVGYADYDSTTTIKHCYWTSDVGYSKTSGSGSSTKQAKLDAATVNNLNSYAKKKKWNRWLLNTNKNAVTFKISKNSQPTYYSSLMIYPGKPPKAYHVLSWCTEDKKLCNPQTVLYGNITLHPVFSINGGLVAGTVIGSILCFAALFMIVLLIALKIKRDKMKAVKGYLDVELAWIKGADNSEESERITEQFKATKPLSDLGKKLSGHLKSVDRSKSICEVLSEMGVECQADGAESFKVTGVASAVANAIQNGTNIKAATEYISLLYREVREQQEEGGSKSLRSCTLG